MLGHASLRWHRVLRASLLDVALVRHCLLGIHRNVGHVALRHVGRGQAGSRGLRDVCVGRLLGRVDLVGVVDAVLVAGCRLGCVQAGLGAQC